MSSCCGDIRAAAQTSSPSSVSAATSMALQHTGPSEVLRIAGADVTDA